MLRSQTYCRARVIAVVGALPTRSGPANVAQFCNPKAIGSSRSIRPAGQTLLGETVYATLSDIPVVDMVDVFRASEAVSDIVDTALELPSVQ